MQLQNRIITAKQVNTRALSLSTHKTSAVKQSVTQQFQRILRPAVSMSQSPDRCLSDHRTFCNLVPVPALKHCPCVLLLLTLGTFQVFLRSLVTYQSQSHPDMAAQRQPVLILIMSNWLIRARRPAADARTWPIHFPCLRNLKSRNASCVGSGMSMWASGQLLCRNLHS